MSKSAVSVAMISVVLSVTYGSAAEAAENPFGPVFEEYALHLPKSIGMFGSEIWMGELGKTIIRFEFRTTLPEEDGGIAVRQDRGFITSYSDPSASVIDRCRWEGDVSSTDSGFTVTAPKAGCWRRSDATPGDSYEDMGATAGSAYDCLFTTPE